MKIIEITRQLWEDENGQVATEYALSVLMVVAFTIGVKIILAEALVSIYEKISFILSQPYP